MTDKPLETLTDDELIAELFEGDEAAKNAYCDAADMHHVAEFWKETRANYSQNYSRSVSLLSKSAKRRRAENVR